MALHPWLKSIGSWNIYRYLYVIGWSVFISGCRDAPTMGDPPVVIPVQVEWDAPTMNADGTPLNDLAGYRVYVDGAVVADGLSSTIHTLPIGVDGRVSVAAYDTSGNESIPVSE